MTSGPRFGPNMPLPSTRKLPVLPATDCDALVIASAGPTLAAEDSQIACASFEQDSYSNQRLLSNQDAYCKQDTAMLTRRGRPSIAEAEALSGRILDASWDVLLASGFEAFTFDRVARHAHIGKATIYSRFAGKIELMQALLLRRVGQRSDAIRQQGSDLPIEEAFCLRATETMKMLFSPDGLLTERLIEWLDQEIGQGPQLRTNVYRNAIDSLAHLLVSAHDMTGLDVASGDLAARLWLEGLLGHARLAYTEGASSPAEIERWARDHTRFFFAGLRTLTTKS